MQSRTGGDRRDPGDAEPIALSALVGALSFALDLTEGQDPGHAQRTCVVGMRIAKQAGWPEMDLDGLFYSLLLKDVGCSGTASQTARLFGGNDVAVRRAAKLVDWTRSSEVLAFVLRQSARDRRGFMRLPSAFRTMGGLRREAHEIVQTRCDRGAQILTRLNFPAQSAAAVAAAEEYWDGSGRPNGLRGAQIPAGGRLLCLAQTVEIFHRNFGRDAARQMVLQRRGRWFDPELADAFLAVHDSDGLWHALDRGDLAGTIAALQPSGSEQAATDELVDEVCEAFSLVVDAKSPSTAGHSTRMTGYALAIADALGADEATRSDVRRAALLHDIGKLGVSSAILDKPGLLTPDEREHVELHARYTYDVLARVPGLRRLAAASAAHHERLDGRGYHLGLAGRRIPGIARVLAVADVFDALTSDRPYRGAMAPDEALDQMWREVDVAFDRSALSALMASRQGSPK